MRLFYSAAQAGNRSGTGRYTEALLRALAEQADLSITVEGDACGARVAAAMPVRAWGRVVGPGGPYDVMHYPANFCPVLGTRNTVVTVHDLSFLRYPGWFRADRAAYYRAAFALTLRRASCFIADSAATRDDLIALAQVPAERIHVAHLGVSPIFRRAAPDAIAALRARHVLPPQFFLYVGTQEPRKNLPRLLAAFDRAAPQLAQDLVIVGREGWKVGPIRTALDDMQHRARVHFPGFIDDADLPALLSAADGFAWPSLFEGFGLPPLEALACGTPVLTGNTSSLPELFTGHAHLVDPTDADAIAAGLIALAAGGPRADASSIAHAQGFTWSRCAQAVRKAYGALLVAGG